jgi:hypothetical protein
MARDRKRHACDEGLPTAVPAPAIVLATGPTTPSPAPPAHQQQLLDLIRALARDAARADHAADLDARRGSEC